MQQGNRRPRIWMQQGNRRPGVWLQSKTSAERRKETALQGSFRSEGTGDRRGLQPDLGPTGAL